MLYLSGLAAMATALSVTVDSTAHHQILFNQWKLTHSKIYEGVEAESNAFDAFVENDNIISEHNSKGLSYWLGHNEFSDMTWAQFKSTMLPPMPETFKTKGTEKWVEPEAAAPDAIDWVTKGAVTEVKNQGQCGSCWSFSTTGSLEGAFQIANGTLISLSEQDLVSCDKVDSGCNGGLMDNAFGWIKTNGICAEEAYPYTSAAGSAGTCKKTCTPVVGLTGFTDVPAKDEASLLKAVAIGPVSVAIEADKSAFQLYKGGVLDNSGCGTQLDHGVLVVGYGTDSGKDYWKVKNSWGKTWGEAGYIRMVRNQNQCGIASQPSYPTGAKPLAPGPGPAPSPTPPSPSGATHYGDPNVGCESDEINIQVQGVSGSMCAPSCGFFKKCPTDVPTGVTAAPQCALQDASAGKKYCALICSPSEVIEDQQAADAQCGTNASCKAIQGVGICTYDQ